MKRLLFAIILAISFGSGCGDDSQSLPAGEGSEDGVLVLPSLGLGGGDTDVSFYISGSPNLTPPPLSEEKGLSVSDPFVEEFTMEIRTLRLVDGQGRRREIPVQATYDLARSEYATSLHLLAQDGLPAGTYSRLEIEVGKVTVRAKLISPDAMANLKSLEGTIVPVATQVTLKAKEEVGLPLLVDLRELARDPTRVRAGIPFATRISVLEVKRGLMVWTTGDFFGFANEQGELFEYRRDFVLARPIGRYIRVSEVEGAYLITDGPQKGVQGAYRLVQGGIFSGDRRGIFRLNGALTGGIWISTVPEVGTFTLDQGAVPNGTGRFYRLTGEFLGTFDINSDVTGGTWTFADGSGSGTLSYAPD